MATKIDINNNNVKFMSETQLHMALETQLRKRKDKLSDLFIVIPHTENFEFEKHLKEDLIRDLKLSLRKWEFEHRVALTDMDTVDAYNTKYKSSLEDAVDTNKILVFFSTAAPKRLLMSRRRFPYPRVKPSTRAFSEVGGKASHITQALESTFPKKELVN